MGLIVKNNRGSHVGVVLSFVIFMTFIIFVYAVLNPAINQEDKKSFFDSLKPSILDRVSGNLTSVGVSITKTNPADCVELSNFFSDSGLDERILVVTDSGENLDAGVSSDNLQIQRDGNTFFSVYRSQEFPEETTDLGSCDPTNQNQYELGLIKTNDYVFESKIIELFSERETDYDSLKGSFNFNGNGFGLGFEYGNGTKISTEDEEFLGTVYSGIVPVEYVSSQGKIEEGSINIRVW